MFKYTALLALVVLASLLVHDYYLLERAVKYLPIVDWLVKTLGQSTPVLGKGNESKGEIFSAEDLKKFTDVKNGLYLAILGEVYDVSKGSKYYAPGESYHFFTGRDGSRAFISGDFSEAGLRDDVLDLSPQDLSGLFDWIAFYKKDYLYKGILVGRYYDANGNPTEYKLQVEEKLRKAKEHQTEEDQEKLLLPPCNVEWNPDSGSRVWCSNMSGGIKRKWIGVPRKLYSPGSDSFRCACVNLDTEISHRKTIKEYSNCDPRASSCDIGNV